MASNTENVSIWWLLHSASQQIYDHTWMQFVSALSNYISYLLGVQRYTWYREFCEMAVQDTYRDTKKWIEIRIVTMYYILLYFDIW